MPGMNLTRQEAQERAEIVTKVHSYDVNLDLTQGDKTFLSDTTVKFSALPGKSTFIDAITDKVHSVTLNGKELNVDKVVEDNVRILLPKLEKENELHVVGDFIYTHSGEGLHRAVDPADNEVYVYTQFEVPDSRRMYTVFEQPDLKSQFTFTAIVPDHWKVISNAPTPKAKKLGDGKAKWSFAQTQIMSSYVTALVAGPYQSTHDELTSSSGKTIPLSIYARKSMFGYIDTAHLFKITKQGFAFYEKNFKTPYPFESYDQVFVPDFNAGAMENAGCVTYRDDYVFRSKVSDAVLERRDLTFLHELAHMWFGDLVTMRWWNDLWLNESFAEFMSTFCSVHGTQWEEAWTTFSIMEKTWAYRQDQLSSTHPIMAEIRDLDDIQVNFDGITYAKGASVLKQLVAWVGLDEFMAGIVEYFKKHAWGNTELPDLMTELEKASSRNLDEWTKKWLETAGVNILSPVVKTDGKKITSFTIEQSNEEYCETLRPHRIGLGFYNLKGDKVIRDEYFEGDVDGKSIEIDEVVGKNRPNFILLNDKDFAYAKIFFDDESMKFIEDNIAKFEDSLARAVIWSNVWEMVRSQKFSSLKFIDMFIENISTEDQSNILMILLRQVSTAVDFYVPEDKIKETRAKVADALFKLMHDAEPGSDAQFQFAQNFISYAESDKHLAYIKDLRSGKEKLEGLNIDTDLDWSLLFALIAGGAAGEKDIVAAAEKDKTTLGNAKEAYARAAIPTAKAKKAAWKELTENEDLSNTMLEYTGGGFARANDIELLKPYIDPYFEIIKDIWENRSHEIGQYIIDLGYPASAVSKETLAKTDAWLKANTDAPAGLIRHIQEARDSMARALKVRQAA
ncbi:MAG: aminopeptidase N [Micrococcaceae bacterium]